MFELLFRHSAADFRAGTLVLASGWPLWALVAAIAIAAAVVGVSAWRTRGTLGRAAAGIALLDIAAAALALVLLWRPALAVDRLESTRNIVAVLVDTSRSMGIAEGGRSRLDVALAALRGQVLPALQERFDVRLYAFSDELRDMSDLGEAGTALGEHTRLAPALRQVLDSAQSLPLSAVVLMSDGGGGREPIAALGPDLERAGVPVHAVGVGREVMSEDLELAAVSAPARVLPGSRIAARVAIRHSGSGSARLRVSDGAALLAARTIALDPARPTQSEAIAFEVSSAGMHDLRFALDPVPGETVVGNNAQGHVLEVLPERRRVLYVEGEPRWDYAFVRRALERDPGIELVGLLHTTDRKRYRQGIREPGELESGFPADRAALFAYDALVLGSLEAAELSAAQHELIRAFVAERGGGLLLAGGRRGLADGGWGATALQEALPVELGRADAKTFVRAAAQARLTPYGASSPIVQLDPDPQRNRELWSELPGLADHQRVGALKPGALALLEIAAGRERAQPLLVVQRYGQGRVAVLASGGTWRWKMQLPHEDTRFATFWRQLLRHLAAPSSPSVALSVSEQPEDSQARVLVQVRDRAWQPAGSAHVSLRVVPEGESEREVQVIASAERGAYEARFAAEPGLMYRVDAQVELDGQAVPPQSLHFRYAPDRTEDFAPEMYRAGLERIAKASGGAFWSAADLSALPEAIRTSGLGARRREILELWSAPICFALLLLLKGGAWIARRALGAR